MRPASASILLCLLVAMVAPVRAAGPAVDMPEAQRQLERIEQELAERAERQRALADAAAAAGRESEAISRRLIALAAEVQQQEERVRALGLKVEALGGMLADAETRLMKRRGQMMHTLSALLRLGQRPPALALLRPGEADAAITSALVLRDLTPRLRDKAREIALEIAQIRALRTDLAAERERLDAGLASLGERREALDAARARQEAERRRLEGEAASEAAAMKQLVARARTLEELVAALDAERERRRRAPREA
ncbi:MAG: murein hydrolase activator EnvC family protein, partial [Rhodothalassiaceae bacterium]